MINQKTTAQSLLISELLGSNPYRKSEKVLSKRREYLYDYFVNRIRLKDRLIEDQDFELEVIGALDLFNNCSQEQIQNHAICAFNNIKRRFRKTTYWSTGVNLGGLHKGLSPKEISEARNRAFSTKSYSTVDRYFYLDTDDSEFGNFETETIDQFLSRGGKIKKCRPSSKSKSAMMKFWKIY